VLAEAARQLSSPADHDLVMEEWDDSESVFRYEMRTMPVEAKEHIGTSAILAAWNAAAYVAQIDEERMEEAVAFGAYHDGTRSVLQRYGRVWFNNESYVIRREPA